MHDIFLCARAHSDDIDLDLDFENVCKARPSCYPPFSCEANMVIRFFSDVILSFFLRSSI